MNNNEEICNLCIDSLYSMPYETLDWKCIQWGVHNVKDDPMYFSYLSKIYIAAIKNSLVYLHSNNTFIGCPGNIAKHLIHFLGAPSYLNRDMIKSFLFVELYGLNYCTCGQIYCEFSPAIFTLHQ